MSPQVLNNLVIDMALRIQCPFGNLFPCGGGGGGGGGGDVVP